MRLRLEIDSEPIDIALLESIEIKNELSGRSSTASFKLGVTLQENAYGVERYDVAHYDLNFDVSQLPHHQSEVIIYDDDTDDKLFRGFVTQISREQQRRHFQFWSISCIGLEYLLENILISRTWTDKSDRFILQDAFGDLLPEITTENATVSQLQTGITFEAKDITLRELVTKLSELSGADFYCSPEKELVYRASGSVEAPFAFSSEPDGVDTFNCRNASTTTTTNGFANKVTVFGAYVGTEELKAVAENTASQLEIGLREARVAARDINNQTALDLAAVIELEKRAVLQQITFSYGTDDEPLNGLKVGMLVHIQSKPLSLNAAYVVQTLQMNQLSDTWTEYTATLGDFQGSLYERMRKLERIKNDPLVVASPPPLNGVTKEHIVSVNATAIFGDIIADQITSIRADQITGLIQAGQINTLTIGQVTGTIYVDAENINGSITSDQIESISIAKVTGTIQVNSSNILGDILFSQIDDSTIEITDSMLTGDINFSKVDGLTVTITGSQIGSLTITDGNIANNTITSAKIVSLSVDKLEAGTITASISISSGGTFTCDDSALFGGGAKCDGIFWATGTGVFSSEISCSSYVQCNELHINGGGAVINSSGQFVGPGIDVGSEGVGCGAVNIGGHSFLTGGAPGVTSAGSYTVSNLADAEIALNDIASALNSVISALSANGLVS